MESFSSATEFISYVDTHEVTGSACRIVDERMPGISGVQLLEKLMAGGKRFGVILVSGYRHNSLRQQAEKLCAVAFLDKPFSPSQLKDAINRVFAL